MSDWKFFVLGAGRTPLPNCSRCAWQSESATRHEPEECACLSCHGFYAGTSDPAALAEMNRLHPTNEWAVRTGAASGIIVLDFEGPGKDPDGFTTLDRWEEFSGGWSLPPTGLSARTPSGGIHLYYRHPGGKIPSRNRVLPGCDLKADGGYVVVPHANSPNREWIIRPGLVGCGPVLAPPSTELIDWLTTVRGRVTSSGAGGSRAVGYDYERFIREGCPDGMRDEFFNDLLFRCRKQNMTIETAWDFARFHWLRCAQPPDAEYFMHWEHVEYKLHRVWRTVEPTALTAEQEAWVRGLRASVDDSPHRRGRVTLITR